MKKIKILVLILCILGIGIVLVKVIEKPNNEVLLQYGDSFSTISCVKLNGKEGFEKSKQKYKIVFYIDPYCESCIKSFTVAERMNAILNDFISVNILWRQKPSADVEKKTCVPSGNQYVLDNVKLTNPYPTYFILDDKDEIVLATDNAEKIMQKVLSLDNISNEKVLDRSNSYLLKKINVNNNKPTLIYFAMEGCRDCEAAEEMLRGINIEKKYNMLTIYTEESYGEQEWVDVSKVFLSIYNLEWYPSFLILRQNGYEFIGQMALEDLKQLLL